MLNPLSVKAYDAVTNSFFPAVIKKVGEKYIVEKNFSNDFESELYMTPGWIDLHAHFNEGFGLFGTNADEIGFKSGVCMIVDAGTVGDYTIKGFRKYVEPTIKTNFKLFICISPIGVIYHHEYNAMEYLNVGQTVSTINENRDIISGVKVRIGSEVIRHEGIEPLRLASEVARLTQLPLMVHIGGTPPHLSDMEPFFRNGDIVTHCFNGRGGDAWNADGTPSTAMKKLIDRGVILDVGHGSASFSFEVCEKAIKQGLPKFSISTDLHALSRKKYAFDMATTLTKMLGLSIPLEDIVYGITKLPAEILRLDDWCDLSEVKNATIFRIVNEPDNYYDCEGQTRKYDKKIVPVGVVLNGEFINI
ncbi:amidohydrolase family protein [Paenibacillus cremeus]|uniref:Amidohydrolase family protein n=1 Tax=Paenibacillus cremeus TaxID=2163881 RepID=A0A559K8C3_9BACL|nr:amidohydrolase family protein [Paenibacillus cremeus]TVY08385.1 amidohydrolase family protein [Paenibacillus cremeus]